MKEIYPMWKMVCILKENGPTWATEKTEFDSWMELEKIKEFSELISPKQKDDIIKKFASIKTVLLTDGHLRVKRISLTTAYIKKYHPEFDDKDEADKSKIIKKREIMQIIESCINHERKFIEQDKIEPTLVYITSNGTDFSDPFGLIKQYIYAIGPIWGAVGLLATALISYFFGRL